MKHPIKAVNEITEPEIERGALRCCSSGGVPHLGRRNPDLQHKLVRLQLWRLAKSVMASLEIWHHQAIVHLLQTHLVVEPYIIATRRSLSAMHPVGNTSP